MENQKKMSLFDLVFMSIGGIIGAGIFSMVGTGIATTGRSVALALIFTMSQQIRYIFTASMFQLSGGMYSQNALVLSPFLAGVSAVVTLVSSVSYSVFGISMAQYLGDLFPVLEPYQVPVACLVLIFFFIIASTGAQILPGPSMPWVSSSSLPWACSSSLASPRCRPAALKANPTSSTAA